MLSNENIKKLKMDGVYKCQPNAKYRSEWHKDNLYHCCNWTFEIIKNREGEYYMRDTYWSSGDSFHIQLTDENIGQFDLIFEWDNVKKISSDEIDLYDKYYRVAVDSAGISYPKYYVDANATKNKRLILEDINKQIKNLTWKIESLQGQKERIENGSYDLNRYY
jgi:hypothetical protein